MFRFGRKFTVEEFEEHALPHFKDLLHTAKRLTGSLPEAEDIVQETYLQAWHSFHKFQPGTNCRAWLYKIMFNLLNKHYRKSRRVLAEESLQEHYGSLQSVGPVPDKVLADSEVLAMIDRLPPEYHAVLLLSIIEGYSYSEIAGILGVSLGTVKSRLHRGRRLLQSAIGGFHSGKGKIIPYRERKGEE